MTDTAKLLCGPAYIAATAAAVYTVPAGVTSILRNIHINNVGATNYSFSLGLNGTPVTSSNAIYTNFQVAQNTAFDWSGFLVLPPGGTLWALAQTASMLTIVVAGVEVS